MPEPSLSGITTVAGATQVIVTASFAGIALPMSYFRIERDTLSDSLEMLIPGLDLLADLDAADPETEWLSIAAQAYISGAWAECQYGHYQVETIDYRLSVGLGQISIRASRTPYTPADRTFTVSPNYISLSGNTIRIRGGAEPRILPGDQIIFGGGEYEMNRITLYSERHIPMMECAT